MVRSFPGAGVWLRDINGNILASVEMTDSDYNSKDTAITAYVSTVDYDGGLAYEVPMIGR